MSTTDDLEARIKELETKVDDLTKEVMEGKVDSLRARLDELEVQMNLGGKDVRDQIAPLLDQFGGRITEIKAEVALHSDLTRACSQLFFSQLQRTRRGK